MQTTQRVGTGALLVSLFLLLFSVNTAAAFHDEMQEDMDATFEEKFDNFDANFDQTPTDSFDDVDSDDTTVSDPDNSDSLDDKMDEMKEHVKDKFSDGASDSDDTTDSAPSDSWDDGVSSPEDSDDSDTSDSWNDGSSDGSDGTGDAVNDGGSSDNWGDGSSDSTPSGDLESRTEQVLHNLLNQERQERGLHPLDFDSNLQETARAKSQDMAANNYFAHTSPSGDNFRDLYNQYGVSCYAGGENIARTWFDRDVQTDTGSIVHYDNAEELANGLRRQWMTSDGHRRAILRSRYDRHGLGIEITDDNRVYATEHFC